MASQQSADTPPAARPSPDRLSSYSHQPSTASTASRETPKRAHTFHSPSPSEKHGDAGASAEAPDTFDTAENSDNDEPPEITRASIELDDLPIELITLTDSFVESLSAKVHSTPPNIAKLSQLFQEFYTTASSHIGTHISALASRQSPSLGSKDKSKAENEQQMITPEELANRKKARKALEAKRSLLEEAVERRLCEGIYDRIYRHRSTQDEAQDAKLRSKTAALSLVGIGPSDLGIDLGEVDAQTEKSTAERTEIIRGQLESARKDLVRMGESRYPLGKLNRLKAAHKSIVDTLAQFHPSASADEIMPMLIYTLITLPPEHLNVISDLNFIQSFRWEQKLTGEEAYCLTNLEAAISFLQTVDLATLREDERPSGPVKTPGQPATPRVETFPPAYSQGLTTSPQSTSAVNTENATAPKPESSPSLKPASTVKNRRLSDLINTPTQAFGAASDAVFTTADQGLKTISNSLGESYSFLLGKLKERQEDPKEPIAVPKTLDDARKLVSTPPPEDEDTTISLAAAAADTDQVKPQNGRDDRVLSIIGGRRDHSTDSARSGRSASSSKKVLFAAEDAKAGAASPAPAQPAMLDQMRNLGNTFNPMARLSGISLVRGFGRSVSTPVVTPPKDAKDATKDSKDKDSKDAKDGVKPTDGGDLATAFPDIAGILPPKEIPKISPPNKRFMELQNPGDLRLSEVLDLLKDYRRLAGALKNMGAFEDK
ncbi:vacuolar sorting protein 9 (VPS9) domain-containing protein [Trichoderma breve]|uniref:Vacuolar sorting protein 9 (VPS9) domain-containing protein n=1 Tax=Trichoderma breve TaxID=2034170 RepID=A0A9W9E7J1_9HYPO|nr:vacuolar sorting protein 9 (VPS9) domain-containing protein [Trichoderma breve]KAJ4860435.1 vacuolar sorting protein 9 (VPS9) domain-containing protein [Trichoderma breve]